MSVCFNNAATQMLDNNTHHMLLIALLLVLSDVGLFGADRKEPPIFSLSHSPPVQPDTPTNGDISHSGHTVAEETDSQTISILTISQLRTQQHHLQL